MLRSRGWFAAVLAVGVVLGAGRFVPPVAAKQMGDFDAQRTRPKVKDFIVYAPELQTAVAGKRSVLELNFHVLEGLHVNSHTPTSELLIATTLTLDAAPGIKTGAPVYPAGTAYSFSFAPNEKLDVYSGGFTVKLPVVAQAGEHTIQGKLRYQACDRAACYPPKTLPVEVAIAVR
jgi:Disulphide bond corrector protein DsbC